MRALMHPRTRPPLLHEVEVEIAGGDGGASSRGPEDGETASLRFTSFANRPTVTQASTIAEDDAGRSEVGERTV